MGGNAIKNSKRIERIEYNQLIVEILQLFPQLRMIPTKTFRNKKTFGDIDFIVESNDTESIKNLVKEHFGKDLEYASNNMFFSFSYKGVQIDFNIVNNLNYISMYNYSGDGDLGNFIGRIARSLNFKYGHDGLSYEYHLDDTHKISVNISKDINSILTFLGYDYFKWLNGFDEPEDIFAYATETPYFNSLYFTLEDQSHNDRVRNRKRKMYQDMLAYLIENKFEPRPKLTPDERLEHYERARAMFGDDFHNKVEEAKKSLERKMLVSKYFNGNIVRELTGYTDKTLGDFMKFLKNTDISQYILWLYDNDVDAHEKTIKYVDQYVAEREQAWITQNTNTALKAMGYYI
jgi:hypothetical protein